MEDRVEGAPQERLEHVMRRVVIDPNGVRLGVVVGRILSGNTVDLLVRRRRLFHRSRFTRLQGAAVEVREQILVFHPPAPTASVRLDVVRERKPDDRETGDAA
jgi:hypothetical protein